jgi:hypothetical protein
MKTFLNGDEIFFNSKTNGVYRIGDVWNLTSAEYLDTLPAGWTAYEVLQDLIQNNQIPNHLVKSGEAMRLVREQISVNIFNQLWDSWDMNNQFTFSITKEEDKEAEETRSFSRHDTASWAGNNTLASSFFRTTYEKSTAVLNHNGKPILTIIFHSEVVRYQDGKITGRHNTWLGEVVKDFIRQGINFNALGVYDLRKNN